MTRAFIVAVALALLAPAAASAQALPDGSTIKEPRAGRRVPDRRRCAAVDQRLRLRAGLPEHCRSSRTSTTTCGIRATARSRASTTPRWGVPLRQRHAAVAQPLRQHAELLRRGDRRRQGLADRSAPRPARAAGRDRGRERRRRRQVPFRRAARPCSSAATWARAASNSVQVDSGTFGALGSHRLPPKMRQYPADGTVVQTIEDGAFYRFAGNAALPLSSCDGCAAVAVDALTLRLAGTGTAAIRTSPPHPPRHLPHDGREHLPDRRRGRRPAQGLHAARRLRGRGHRGRGHDRRPRRRSSAGRAQGRHGAARAAVQAHVGDRRRQAAGDVHRRASTRSTSTTARST